MCVCLCVLWGGATNDWEVVGRRELVGEDGEEETMPALECTQVEVLSGVTSISEGVGEV